MPSCTLAPIQCREGVRRVFTDQADTDCTKREEPCGVGRVSLTMSCILLRTAFDVDILAYRRQHRIDLFVFWCAHFQRQQCVCYVTASWVPYHIHLVHTIIITRDAMISFVRGIVKTPCLRPRLVQKIAQPEKTFFTWPQVTKNGQHQSVTVRHIALGLRHHPCQKQHPIPSHRKKQTTPGGKKRKRQIAGVRQISPHCVWRYA